MNNLSACPDGWIDLYHRTSREAAETIAATGRMESKENTPEAYFSTVRDSEYTGGYGEAVIGVRVPLDRIELEDEFETGEQHYRVPLSEITKERLLPLKTGQ